MRTVLVDGVTYVPGHNITRDGKRWRVQVDRVGSPSLRRGFSDREYGSPATALSAAQRWLREQAPRQPYQGIDLTRTDERRMTLTRRVRTRGDGTAIPRYELEISPSKSGWRQPWMRVFLGSIKSIDQARVDAAIGTLRARWAAYQDHCKRYGPEEAAKLDGYTELPPVPATEHGTRLSFEDVVLWNGKGTNVGYCPAADVDPERQVAYWPEATGKRALKVRAA